MNVYLVCKKKGFIFKSARNIVHACLTGATGERRKASGWFYTQGPWKDDWSDWRLGINGDLKLKNYMLNISWCFILKEDASVTNSMYYIFPDIKIKMLTKKHGNK